MKKRGGKQQKLLDFKKRNCKWLMIFANTLILLRCHNLLSIRCHHCNPATFWWVITIFLFYYEIFRQFSPTWCRWHLLQIYVQMDRRAYLPTPSEFFAPILPFGAADNCHYINTQYISLKTRNPVHPDTKEKWLLVRTCEATSTPISSSTC